MKAEMNKVERGKCLLRDVENELDGLPRRVEISADGS